MLTMATTRLAVARLVGGLVAAGPPLGVSRLGLLARPTTRPSFAPSSSSTLLGSSAYRCMNTQGSSASSPVFRIDLESESMIESYSEFLDSVEKTVKTQVINETKFTIMGQNPPWVRVAFEIFDDFRLHRFHMSIWRASLYSYAMRIEKDVSDSDYPNEEAVQWFQFQDKEFDFMDSKTIELPFGVSYPPILFDKENNLGPFELGNSLLYLVSGVHAINDPYVHRSFIKVVVHILEPIRFPSIRNLVGESMRDMSYTSLTIEHEALIKNWVSLSKFLLKHAYQMMLNSNASYLLVCVTSRDKKPYKVEMDLKMVREYVGVGKIYPKLKL